MLDGVENFYQGHELAALALAERYAMIIKQRLDEAELLRMPSSPAVGSTATLQQVKYLVKKFILSGKP